MRRTPKTNSGRWAPIHIKTQALVLRESKYKESDKILTILTPGEGKRTVKAQGCLRKGSPLAAACQLLSWSEMVLFEYRDYYTLREASTLEEFRGLRTQLERLALGSYFAEVAETVAEEGVPQAELVSLMLNSLFALDSLPEKPLALVKAAFELRLMAEAGFEPMLDACAVCGVPEPKEPRLHLNAGVLHCAACRAGAGEGISMPLRGSALQAMRYIVCAPPKKFLSLSVGPKTLDCLGQVSEAYLMAQLERGFRTLDFYKQLALPNIQT